MGCRIENQEGEQVMVREYEVCIKGIRYEEAQRRGRELFNKLLEKLDRAHGVRVEECEDIDGEGFYECFGNGRRFEVDYFYASTGNKVCIYVEEVGK